MNNSFAKFSIIHFMLCLFLPVFFVVLTGCEPTRDEGPSHYVPEDLVNEVIESAFDFTRIATSKKGEAVVFASSANVLGNPISDKIFLNKKQVLELNDEVINFEDGEQIVAKAIYLADVYIQADNRGNIESQTNFEKKSCYVEGLGEINCKFVTYVRPQKISLLSTVNASSSVSTSSSDILYFNLRSEEKTIVPPRLVQERENCGGIPECKIKVTEINFQQEYLEKGRKRSAKVHLTISKEVPWFASMLKQCVTAVGSIGTDQNGQDVEAQITQCNEAVDFKFGE